MKITSLIENRVSRMGLVAEHGLCFYIETNGWQILFDIGAGANYASNAEYLGIDISQIDFLVISHGHSDHTGGLGHFLEINSKALIFTKKNTFDPKFKFNKYIGISPKIHIDHKRFHFIDTVFELVPGIHIFPDIVIQFQTDQHKSNFFTQYNNTLVPDNFNDELFLVLKSRNGLSILSSCSHSGITNMVETAENHFKLPVIKVIGGFHLIDGQTEATQHIISYFNSKKIQQVYTGHCTGIEKFAQLKTKCNARVQYFETGDAIEL